MFVDAWTSLGGSQFLNSTRTGRYLDYLCDEVVPFVDARYPTLAGRDHRGLAGKSSGGYGAMVVPMLRPDVFGALASHAGDALFECCYLPDVPAAWPGRCATTSTAPTRCSSRSCAASRPLRLRAVRRAVRDVRLRVRRTRRTRTARGEALLPFEIATGRLIEDVWARWLEHDPVRMAPHHADALRSMRRIYLDAGRSDEYFLDLGAQAFAEELSKLGVAHTLELFDGKHGGITYRYPGAIRELVTLRFRDRRATASATTGARVRRPGRAREHGPPRARSHPRELVELCLRRIEAIDPRLNAFRVTLADEALAAADAVSSMRRCRWPASRSRSRTTCRSPGQVDDARLALVRAARAGRRRGGAATARRAARSRSGSRTSPS